MTAATVEWGFIIGVIGLLLIIAWTA